MKKTLMTVLALSGVLAMDAIPVNAADMGCGNINVYTINGSDCIACKSCNANELLSNGCNQAQLSKILSGNISSNELSEILNGCGIKLTEINCPDGICTSPSDGYSESSEANIHSEPTIPTDSKTDNNQPEQSVVPIDPALNGSEGISEYESKVIALVNNIRTQNGLATLKADPELCRIARIKSQDMKDRGYFSHNSPTYGSPFDMMKQFGISYHTAGENIAMGQQTPESVVNAWMNSEGHRANILNSSFTTIGVGYVADGNYWTQMFIG